MDSLISRKAALESLGERPENWTDSPEEIEAVRAYDNAVDNLKAVPSAPAVPLDKLCEWLGKQGMLSPCYFNQDCDECELKPYWQHKKSECWEHVLTKWMEELDAN